MIEIPTKYFLIATLVTLAAAIPVVVHFQGKVVERNFTVNYRLVVKHYILWQFIWAWLFFICLNLLLVRIILLNQGFSYSKDQPLEFMIALPLIYAAGCLSHIMIYSLLSTKLTDEKYEALFTQPPLPSFGLKLTLDIAIVLIAWGIALTIVFVNSPA